VPREIRLTSHFFESGKVSVLVDNSQVGYCTPGSLIGEISIPTGKPATARVIATESSHYLALEREALHRLMKADTAFAIDVGNRLDLEGKLIRMNQAALRAA